MNDIGHNQPPDMTVTAGEVCQSINDWLKENPVVTNEEEAKEAKSQIDRGKLCVKDLEAERDKKVRPLNERVKEINGYYRGPKTTLEEVTGEAAARLAAYLRAEEQRRIAKAEEARLAAEAAEQAARLAEQAEQEKIDAARTGELGVDISEAKRDADEAFKEYERTSRFAERAERDAAKTKVGGGFTRAVGLKNVETLEVDDPLAAFMALWPTADIEEALLKAARAYRKTAGQLPPGVIAHVERKL